MVISLGVDEALPSHQILANFVLDRVERLKLSFLNDSANARREVKFFPFYLFLRQQAYLRAYTILNL